MDETIVGVSELVIRRMCYVTIKITDLNQEHSNIARAKFN